jgi:hypothetical protein
VSALSQPQQSQPDAPGAPTSELSPLAPHWDELDRREGLRYLTRVMRGGKPRLHVRMRKMPYRRAVLRSQRCSKQASPCSMCFHGARGARVPPLRAGSWDLTKECRILRDFAARIERPCAGGRLSVHAADHAANGCRDARRPKPA